MIDEQLEKELEQLKLIDNIISGEYITDGIRNDIELDEECHAKIKSALKEMRTRIKKKILTKVSEL